ncbi:MAG TPA: hypothetical protein VFB60_11335 [Ktedonobacteraceae bacterium]|nr:hypothetical protein [Ktedonobacteraceae bacterium]
MAQDTMIGIPTSYTINKFFLYILSSSTSATFSPEATVTIQSSQPTLTSSDVEITTSSSLHPARTDVKLDSESETQWHDIVNTPQVQQALLRLAAEAKRQVSAGEIEEGGFAFE